MAAEDNKAIVEQVVDEIWNFGDLTLVDEIYAANFVGHWPDRELIGVEAVKEQVQGLHSASVNLRFVIEDRIAEGDRVLTRFLQHCSRRPDMNGFAPKDEHETREGMSVVRFERGKIVEQWVYFET